MQSERSHSKFHSCHGANRCPRAKPAVRGEEYKLEMAFSSCLPCGCSILEGLNPEDTDLVCAELPAVISCYQTWLLMLWVCPAAPPGAELCVCPTWKQWHSYFISVFGTVWKDRGGIP